MTELVIYVGNIILKAILYQGYTCSFLNRCASSDFHLLGVHQSTSDW